MRFSILGPLEVRDHDGEVGLGGIKRRGVLAVLVLHANEPVSAERLALAVWGEEASVRAVKTVQVCVSRLRRTLGDGGILESTPGGYRLRIEDGQLDAQRFERLVGDGRRALAAGQAEQAASLVAEALRLWRGAPLVELASLPFAPDEIARLEEQRVAALELRVEADMAAGRHAELVPELQRLAALHPWRERLHGQLMLALYRGGRQGESLETYRRVRQTLVDELGVEPGAELRELHRAVLDQDADAPARDERALPAAPNRTIGREEAIRVLAQRLRTEGTRLLTITGPGGVGKTRLALEAARAVEEDFTEGAYFVELAPLERAEDVGPTVVRSVGIAVLPGESPAAAVRRFLGGKRVLLVMDNFEHLLTAPSFVAGLLAACRGVTVLATSREPLALQAEERYPVAGLGGRDSRTLFLERARVSDPGLYENDEAIEEICRRVDRLPLAIELAAARCTLLTPVEIAERLDEVLSSRGAGHRDASPHQQSLSATIAWSHDLLDAPEQECFARFAVFAGGATLDAAEAITDGGLEVIERLVAKNLLLRPRSDDATPRLTMLETIRSFASERFDATADRDAICLRHADHYLELAERHGTYRALSGIDRNAHLAVLDAEVENLQLAVRRALRRPDGGTALQLCTALGPYWALRNRNAAALDWTEQALALAGSRADPALRVRALGRKARYLWALGRTAEQPPVLTEALALASELEDPGVRSDTLTGRAEQAVSAGQFDAADRYADEALACARDDWSIAEASRVKAMAASNLEQLRERVDHAAALLDTVGNAYGLAHMLASAAYRALCEGGDRDALMLVRRAETIAKSLDDPFAWMFVRGNAGVAALLTGDLRAARDAFRDELEGARDLVVRPTASEGLLGMAAVAAATGDRDRAARLFGAGSAVGHDPLQDVIAARLDAAYFEAARAGCGSRAWTAATQTGAAMSFGDAIALALSGSAPATD